MKIISKQEWNKYRERAEKLVKLADKQNNRWNEDRNTVYEALQRMVKCNPDDFLNSVILILGDMLKLTDGYIGTGHPVYEFWISVVEGTLPEGWKVEE